MDRKTKKLLNQLESQSAKERFEAVMALGKMGDIELIDELDKVANLDENDKVRGLAQMAVRTLETLRKRRMDRERARILEEEGPDSYEWRELSQEKMLADRDRTVDDEKWTYAESVAKKRQREQEELLRKQMEAEAYKKMMERRRRPRRIINILLASILVIGVLAIAYRFATRTKEPNNPAEALPLLREWVVQQQASLVSYGNAFTKDPLDCAELNGISIPTKPTWANVGHKSLTGLDTLMADLQEVDQILTTLKSTTTTVCTDKETIAKADWVEYVNQEGQQLRGLRLANTLSSQIETQINATPTPEATPEGTPGA